MPQLTRITSASGLLRYFRCPYQAKVMKMLEMVSRMTVHMGRHCKAASGFLCELGQQIERIAGCQNANRPQAVCRVLDERANQKRNGANESDSGRPRISPGAIGTGCVRLSQPQNEDPGVGEGVIGHEIKSSDG